LIPKKIIKNINKLLKISEIIIIIFLLNLSIIIPAKNEKIMFGNVITAPRKEKAIELWGARSFKIEKKAKWFTLSPIWENNWLNEKIKKFLFFKTLKNLKEFIKLSPHFFKFFNIIIF